MIDRLRIYELDFFRFVAAMAVLAFHYTFRGYAADDLANLDFREVSAVTKYGYLGVNFFFMISGFVILLTASSRDATGFAIARFIRLYPIFWICLTVTFCVSLILGGDQFNVSLSDYLVNLTMISSVFGWKEVDGVYWSLLVEIKFYCLIYVILLFKQIKNIVTFLNIWCAYSLLNWIFGLPYNVNFLMIPEYAPYFIAGACFYLARVHGYFTNTVLLTVISIVLSFLYAVPTVERLEIYYDTAFSLPIVLILIGGFFALFLIISKYNIGFIDNKRMLVLGGLSYPLYLLHQNIGYMLFNNYGAEANKWLMLSIVSFVVILASLFIDNVVTKVKRSNNQSKGTKHRIDGASFLDRTSD